ncbi:hypothetical protein HPB51_016782 [Rhipicephalus microplus]|uniref:Uncharacterized protein n=1 Tax=Rhipicephalus microplus TaxID=6941 RepID=A0A9J6DVE6_RHIMP|nr:hypothetical protein HPB51_016782 [Rhipicephalus microplus]
MNDSTIRERESGAPESQVSSRHIRVELTLSIQGVPHTGVTDSYKRSRHIRCRDHAALRGYLPPASPSAQRHPWLPYPYGTRGYTPANRVSRSGRKQKALWMESLLRCSTPARLLYERTARRGAPRCLFAALAQLGATFIIDSLTPEARRFFFRKPLIDRDPPGTSTSLLFFGSFCGGFLHFLFMLAGMKPKRWHVAIAQKEPDIDKIGSVDITKRET